VVGHGEERRIRAIVADHAVSARRTRRRMVSGGGETRRQAAVLGCSTPRHCGRGGVGAAARSRWSTPRMRAHRRFERKVRAEIFLS
jgi:hypothetical protein